MESERAERVQGSARRLSLACSLSVTERVDHVIRTDSKANGADFASFFAKGTAAARREALAGSPIDRSQQAA